MKKEAIVNEKSQNAFKILLRQQIKEYGFEILMKIFQGGISRLGG